MPEYFKNQSWRLTVYTMKPTAAAPARTRHMRVINVR